MIQTGLRVSELTALVNSDITLGIGPHVHCHGKGPQRTHHPIDPADHSGAARLAARTRRQPRRPACSRPAADDRLSRDAVAWLLAKHVAAAARRLPVAASQDDHPAHAAPHGRDAAAARRRRHHRDRALARPREHPDHADLPARRPRAQREERSHVPPRPTPRPAATGHPTSYSRSSRRCDYAEPLNTRDRAERGTSSRLGITRDSAYDELRRARRNSSTARRPPTNFTAAS